MQDDDDRPAWLAEAQAVALAWMREGSPTMPPRVASAFELMRSYRLLQPPSGEAIAYAEARQHTEAMHRTGTREEWLAAREEEAAALARLRGEEPPHA